MLSDVSTPRESQSTPNPEDREDELPIASPASPPKSERAAPPAEPDPLAKWRAAREMEEEMADLFDEDRVTHQHGGTEPEAD
jgi:hypothetical protein